MFLILVELCPMLTQDKAYLATLMGGFLHILQ